MIRRVIEIATDTAVAAVRQLRTALGQADAGIEGLQKRTELLKKAELEQAKATRQAAQALEDKERVARLAAKRDAALRSGASDRAALLDARAEVVRARAIERTRQAAVSSARSEKLRTQAIRAGNRERKRGGRLESILATAYEISAGKLSTLAKRAAAATAVFLSLSAAQSAVARSLDAAIELERIEIALDTATGGAQQGAEALAFVRSEAERLGQSFRSSAQDFTAFAAATQGTALEGEKAREIFVAVAESAAVLGLGARDTTGILRVLTQIISKGKVQAEELRGQLGERLFGAFQLAARAMGITTRELDKMLETGRVTAEVFLPRFAEELRKSFSSGVHRAAASTRAQMERLRNASFDLSAAVGQELAPEMGRLAGQLATLSRDRGVVEFFGDVGRLLGAITSLVGSGIEAWDDLRAVVADFEAVVVRTLGTSASAVLSFVADALGGGRALVTMIAGIAEKAGILIDPTGLLRSGLRGLEGDLEKLEGFYRDLGSTVQTESDLLADSLHEVAAEQRGMDQAASDSVETLRKLRAEQEASGRSTGQLGALTEDLRRQLEALGAADVSSGLEEVETRVEVLRRINAELRESVALARARDFDQIAGDAERLVSQVDLVQEAIRLGLDPLRATEAFYQEILQASLLRQRHEATIARLLEEQAALQEELVEGSIDLTADAPDRDLPASFRVDSTLEDSFFDFDPEVFLPDGEELQKRSEEQAADVAAIWQATWKGIGEFAVDSLVGALEQIADAFISGSENLDEVIRTTFRDLGAEIGSQVGAAFGGPAGAIGGKIVGGLIGDFIGELVGGLFKRGRDEAFARVQVEAGRAVLQFGQVEEKARQALDDLGHALTTGINDFVSVLGGELIAVGDLAIKVRDGEVVRVWIDHVKSEFEDANEALEFALVEGLKRAQIDGLSSNVEAALRSSTATTLEGLASDVEFARAIDTRGFSELQLFLQDLPAQIRSWVDRAAELGVSIDDTIDALRLEAQARRDSLEANLQATLGYDSQVDALLATLEAARTWNESVADLESTLSDAAERGRELAEASARSAQGVGGVLDRFGDLDLEMGTLAGRLEHVSGGLHGLEETGEDAGTALESTGESMAGLTGAAGDAATALERIDPTLIERAAEAMSDRLQSGVLRDLAEITGNQEALAAAQRIEHLLRLEEIRLRIDQLTALGRISQAELSFLQGLLADAESLQALGRSRSGQGGGRRQERDRFRKEMHETELLFQGAGRGVLDLLRELEGLEASIERARQLGIAEEELAEHRARSLALIQRDLLADFQERRLQATETDAQTSLRQLEEERQEALGRAFALAQEIARQTGESVEAIYQAMAEEIERAIDAEREEIVEDLRSRRDDFLAPFVEGNRARDESPARTARRRILEERAAALAEAREIAQELAEVTGQALETIFGPMQDEIDRFFAGQERDLRDRVRDDNADFLAPFQETVQAGGESDRQTGLRRLRERRREARREARQRAIDEAAVTGESVEEVFARLVSVIDEAFGIEKQELLDEYAAGEAKLATERQAALEALEKDFLSRQVRAGQLSETGLALQDLAAAYRALRLEAVRLEGAESERLAVLEKLEAAERAGLVNDTLQGLIELGVHLPVETVDALRVAEIEEARAKALLRAEAIASEDAFRHLGISLGVLKSQINATFDAQLAGGDRRSAGSPVQPAVRIRRGTPASQARESRREIAALEARIQSFIDTLNGLETGRLTEEARALRNEYEALRDELTSRGQDPRSLEADFESGRRNVIDRMIREFDSGGERLQDRLLAVREGFEDLRTALDTLGATSEDLARATALEGAALRRAREEALAPVIDALAELRDIDQTSADRRSHLRQDFRDALRRARTGDLDAARDAAALSQKLREEADLLGGGARRGLLAELGEGLESIAQIGPLGTDEEILDLNRSQLDVHRAQLDALVSISASLRAAPGPFPSPFPSPALPAVPRPLVLHAAAPSITLPAPLVIQRSPPSGELKAMLQTLVAEARSVRKASEQTNTLLRRLSQRGPVGP